MVVREKQLKYLLCYSLSDEEKENEWTLCREERKQYYIKTEIGVYLNFWST